MLEDIALMRVLPHMRVVVPCDAVEAAKATIALAAHPGPAYLRLARDKSPVITTDDTPFNLGKAQVVRSGRDITIAACGTMVYQAVLAADLLAKKKIEVEVINVAVIKPLDTVTILASVRKTNALLTAEEGQIAGGLGGALAELVAEQHPVPMRRVGMIDRFGESGTAAELLEHFGLTAAHLVKKAVELVKSKP
jgi:transketolase